MNKKYKMTKWRKVLVILWTMMVGLLMPKMAVAELTFDEFDFAVDYIETLRQTSDACMRDKSSAGATIYPITRLKSRTIARNAAQFAAENQGFWNILTDENVRAYLVDQLIPEEPIPASLAYGGKTAPTIEQAMLQLENDTPFCNRVMFLTQGYNIGLGKHDLQNGSFAWFILLYDLYSSENFIQPVFDGQSLTFIDNNNFNGLMGNPIFQLTTVPDTADGVGSFVSNEKPDLVIKNIDVIGDVDKSNPSLYSARVKVSIENKGSVQAVPFSVGIFSLTSGQGISIQLPYVVSEDQENVWLPKIDNALSSNQVKSLEGTVYFHPTMNGKTVQLFAIADPCLSNVSCTVSELDEENNVSQKISVDLSYQQCPSDSEPPSRITGPGGITL